MSPPTPDELEKGATALAEAKAVEKASQREKDFIAALEIFYKDAARVPHLERAKAFEEAMGELAGLHAIDYRVYAQMGQSKKAKEYIDQVVNTKKVMPETHGAVAATAGFTPARYHLELKAEVDKIRTLRGGDFKIPAAHCGFGEPRVSTGQTLSRSSPCRRQV